MSGPEFIPLPPDWMTDAEGYGRKVHSSAIAGWLFGRNQRIALRWMRPRSGETWLDLGCGPGNLFPSLHATGARIIGVDIRDWMIDAATGVLRRLDPGHERAHRAIRADARGLREVDTASVDGVVSLETLEHVLPLEPALEEIHRILRPRGKLVYSVPVEFGTALLAREVARRVLGFESDGYSLRELVAIGILGRTGAYQVQREGPDPPVMRRGEGFARHKYFDCRRLRRSLSVLFEIERETWAPFGVRGPWAVSHVVQARRREVRPVRNARD